MLTERALSCTSIHISYDASCVLSIYSTYQLFHSLIRSCWLNGKILTRRHLLKNLRKHLYAAVSSRWPDRDEQNLLTTYPTQKESPHMRKYGCIEFQRLLDAVERSSDECSSRPCEFTAVASTSYSDQLLPLSLQDRVFGLGSGRQRWLTA